MIEPVKLFFVKLDSYINKYYRFLLIDGLIFCSVYFSISILLLSFFEFCFHFSSTVRFLLLVFFFLSNIYLFINKIALNYLKIYSFIKRISYEEACRRIQFENPKLQDILINILQLSTFNCNNLVEASVIQKLARIKDFDFASTLVYNLKSKILFILIPIFVFITFISFPLLYNNGFQFIMHYSADNVGNHIFNVSIENDLNVEKGSDLSINAKVLSDVNIDEIFICFANNRFLMQKQNDSVYTFTLKNIHDSFSFSIENEKFGSKLFYISVYNSPSLVDYKVNIDYSDYVNKVDTIVHNQNILNVPQGTILKFSFVGRYFDTLSIFLHRDSSLLSFLYSDTVFYCKKFNNDEIFDVVLANEKVRKNIINFNVVSIPDVYPNIRVSKLDNLYESDLVFDGEISDDYGFSSLVFCYENDKMKDTVNIPIYNNITSQRFFYTFSKPFMTDLVDKKITCHFEVYDNDEVHGFKKSVSETFSYVVKSIISQVADKEATYESIFNKLEMSKVLSDEIKNDINQFRIKSINDDLSEWERNTLLQQIKSKTNSLESLLDEISKSKNQISKDSFGPDLVEKQNILSEMFNSLVDEELKKMLQEISNLANENKHQISPEDLKKNFNDFTKSLDRNLELLKKVKLEEDFAKLSDNLSILSQNQMELNENTDGNLENSVKLHEEVFDNLYEQYNQIKNDNNQLEKPLNIDDLNNEFDEIKSNFKNEINQIENNDLDSFKKETENNANNLKQLAKRIKDSVKHSSSEKEAENADDLRQILDNLFELSFRQEDIIKKYERVDINSSAYLDQIVEQSVMVENFKLLRDSLYSLSKRTVYLGKHISSVSFLIEDNMIKASSYFQEKSSSRAILSQREALSKMNDLILILSESLKDIDNAASDSGGAPMKNRKHKPKKQDDSISEMRSAQESMKEQLRELLNQMKSGDSEEINKQIAKSLMQNEIYQQMIQQMYNSSEIDDGISKLLREVKALMEKNHSDLANKKLSIQTVMRQQNIINKLLQAENSDNERDTEETRIASAGKNINRNKTEIPIEDIKFEKNIDFLKQDNIRLSSFYKVIFDKYINGINNE